MVAYLLVLFLGGEPIGAVPFNTLTECKGALEVVLEDAPEDGAAACYALLVQS